MPTPNTVKITPTVLFSVFADALLANAAPILAHKSVNTTHKTNKRISGITPQISVSGFLDLLKGKNSLLLFQKFCNMKFAYRSQKF